MADFAGQTIGWDVGASSYDENPASVVSWDVIFTDLGSGFVPPPVTLTFIDPLPPNLPSPGRALLFNVTDVSELGVTIVAEYNTGAYEVVHDGSEFAQVYAAASVRTVIAGGFQYLVRRAGGWFGDSVTIRTLNASADG